jgi:hypothetical protein
MAMMKKKKTMKRDPYAEGIDPSAGRGVPVSAYRESRTYGKPIGPKKPKAQTVNRAAKGPKLMKKKAK